MRIHKSSPNEIMREGEIHGMPPNPEGAQPTRGEVVSLESFPTD